MPRFTKMSLFKNSNQSGFSMVEVTLVAGLIGMLALGSNYLLVAQAKNWLQPLQAMAVSDAYSQVKMAMRHRESCVLTLSGLVVNPSSAVTAVNRRLNTGGTEPVLTVGQALGSRVTVESMSLGDFQQLSRNSADGSRAGLAELAITFATPATAYGKSTQKVPLLISLNSANQVIGCTNSDGLDIYSFCASLRATAVASVCRDPDIAGAIALSGLLSAGRDMQVFSGTTVEEDARFTLSPGTSVRAANASIANAVTVSGPLSVGVTATFSGPVTASGTVTGTSQLCANGVNCRTFTYQPCPSSSYYVSSISPSGVVGCSLRPW